MILQGLMISLSGEGGIRTLGTVARTTVFETATFNHSATSPKCQCKSMKILPSQKIKIQFRLLILLN